VSEDDIAALEHWVHDGLQPDLTVLFDLPIEVARARSQAARRPDRFECEQMEFFARVREGYLRRARLYPQRVRIIDGSGSPAEVEAQLARIDLFQ
jgi:dTMP kinase